MVVPGCSWRAGTAPVPARPARGRLARTQRGDRSWKRGAPLAVCGRTARAPWQPAPRGNEPRCAAQQVLPDL